MKMRSIAPMRVAKIGYIAISVLFCVFGILLLVFPKISTTVIGICVGVALTAFGIVKLVGYFSKDLFRLAFQFDLEFGILMILLGIIVLSAPQSLMAFLCIALGIATLLDGLFKVRIAMDSRQFGIKSWWVILALAILTGIVGMALIFDSVLASNVFSALLGISLFSEGVLNLYTVASTVLIVKHQLPDLVETESFEIGKKGA